MAPKTIFEKIWADHKILESGSGKEALLYVDRLLLTDSSSFHAFDALEKGNHSVRRPKQIFGVPDHFAPSDSRILEDIDDLDRRERIKDLQFNSKKWNTNHFGINDPRMGITHVVGPEQGITLPGTIVLCGDSHTSTHGALGALAFGIGGQSAHVLATQCLWQKPLKQMRVTVSGNRSSFITAKDIILTIISKIGAGGAFGHIIEFAGKTIENMNIEERLTICNMTIESGGRAGLIAPDEKTFDYLRGRPFAPRGSAWDSALTYWRSLKTEKNAVFDREINVNAKNIEPMVSWGNTAAETIGISGEIPDPKDTKDIDKRKSIQKALEYMDLRPGTRMTDIKIDQVFIGSCTNGRLEDLRAAASIVKGKKARVPALVTPGSNKVRVDAEKEGLAKIFEDAGFVWGQAGCSMCVSMNGDLVAKGHRCASTSNRNFVGRQGVGSRTHLLSPVMAAAAAIHGRFVDVREL